MFDDILVERIVCRLPGRTRSLLVVCEARNFYILKSVVANNSHCNLANEIIAAELMASIGLPVPRVLPSNKVKRFSSKDLLGTFVAVELIDFSPDARVYERLPASLVANVSNSSDFTGCLIFDVWAGSKDSRQAIFVEEAGCESFSAFFIDHGDVFGGADWSFKAVGKSPRGNHLAIYGSELDLKLWEFWIARIRNEALDALPDCLYTLPNDWMLGDRKTLERALRQRAEKIVTLLYSELVDLFGQPTERLICGSACAGHCCLGIEAAAAHAIRGLRN